MKMRDNFMVREIAGEYIAVPCGEASSKVEGLISLNEVAAGMFTSLQNGASPEETARHISSEYEVSFEKALEDVYTFISELKKRNVFEDC